MAKVILVIIMFCFSSAAYAEPKSITMGIKVTLIQCGTQDEARNKCESAEEVRCCPLVDDFSFETAFSKTIQKKEIIQIDVNTEEELLSDNQGTLHAALATHRGVYFYPGVGQVMH